MRRQAAILLSVALLVLVWPGRALAQTQTQTQASPKPAAAPEQAPTPESLGAPAFHQTMQFIESYDAGGGQRFYLFGSNASFSDLVSYYQSQLKQRGELVFEEPATHMFDIGRFQEATMAFPPSITVKDYTWGGMQGYPNPKPNAQPASFKTIVQIVPMPAATPPIKK